MATRGNASGMRANQRLAPERITTAMGELELRTALTALTHLSRGEDVERVLVLDGLLDVRLAGSDALAAAVDEALSAVAGRTRIDTDWVRATVAKLARVAVAAAA